ncbi:MAG: phenylacetate--CoA ligase family protein [Planctomycetota bacterium]|jgi:phenylacetate-CoA ligase
MWPWAVRHLTGPLYDRVRFGGEVARAAAELARTERASAPELARLRRRRREALLAHAAAHVPFYREVFAAAGLETPDAAAALGRDDASFARLPLLTREGLGGEPDRLVARDRPRRSRVRRTSGSTGRPTSVRLDVRSLARHRAAKARARGWLGVAPGDRWVMLWGRDEPRTLRYAAAVELAENRRVLALDELEDEAAARAVARLRRFDPVLLYGFASGLVRLAELWGAAAVPRSLRAVISTAELLSPAGARRLAETFGVPVGLEYGLTEAQLVAGTCAAGALHIAEENVHVEILRDGAPAAPGETGEIVITDLHGYAAPLIRYATGDAGALVGEPCSCGRAHRRLDLQIARTCELFELDGRVYHPEVFTLPHDFPHFDRISRLRVLRTADRSFVVEVVLADPASRDAVTTALERSLRDALSGRRISIEIRPVAEIARDPSGKLRYYLDVRTPGSGGSPPA